MAKSRRVRWRCPTGEHPGELGSTRPPMDATVRYCWPCSVEGGRLVERVAPTLERERAARSATRASAPARRAESLAKRAVIECYDAAGRRHVVDLLEEVRSCRSMLGRDAAIDVTITRRDSYSSGASGRAWHDRLHLTIGPTAKYEDLISLCLHESIHTIPESSVVKSRGKRSYHGPRFKRMLFDAARERWPRIVSVIDDVTRWERTGRAYDLDRAIEDALRTTCEPLTDIERLSMAWESGS